MHKVLVGKPELKKTTRMWDDNIKMYLETKWEDEFIWKTENSG